MYTSYLAFLDFINNLALWQFQALLADFFYLRLPFLKMIHCIHNSIDRRNSYQASTYLGATSGVHEY